MLALALFAASPAFAGAVPAAVGVPATATQFTGDLETEQSPRAAIGPALYKTVSAFEGVLADLGVQFTRVKKHRASGTAMWGNAFRVDMKSSRTSNAAASDGTHGGALRMETFVSPHIAFNAGVGLKRGKTARVGFTLGW